MKKIVGFIVKMLIFMIVFLSILFFSTILYAYISSDEDNITIENAISYVQSIGNEIIHFTFTDKSSLDNFNSNNIDTTTDNVQYSDTYINNKKNKYYYNQLDSNAKLIYTTLENNIDNFKKENYDINFSTQFNKLLHETTGEMKLNKAFQSALDAFSYDYPELFYIDITKITLIIKNSSIGPLSTYTVSISPKDNENYLSKGFYSESEVNAAISKIKNIRNNIITDMYNLNDYNKILNIHSVLVNSLSYDSVSNNSNNNNIYGALIQRNAICEGYAKAFKYILDSLNIENILVSGTATNSSNKTDAHMWNYVKLNNNWYAVDVTWDDPIIIGGASRNNLRYDYFLKGNSTFIKSHVPSGRISYSGMLFSLPVLNYKDYK